MEVCEIFYHMLFITDMFQLLSRTLSG